ncbi:MAG TPA: bacteriohemerythrin [Vicinamibacteria bacterium]|nr:bacteriohemerythrin [Vicinamibacteria bacterium]
MAREPATTAPAGFAWTDDFLVGIAEIDEQHRGLVDMINGFYAALTGDAPHREALGALLRGLVDYTKYHFATEERLMQEAKLPLTRPHLKQHQEFVQKVGEMADRFSHGGLVLSVEATSYLRDWLQGHILGTDKHLGRELQRRGFR